MPPDKHRGSCDKCDRAFDYYVVHNGFNDSSYAYCSGCGLTALIDTNQKDRSDEGLPPHRSITAKGEHSLAGCGCGGSFKAGATPRCPHCNHELSAKEAARWIESQAPGTSKGWKWQNNWEGLYAIVINDRVVSNPWK